MRPTHTTPATGAAKVVVGGAEKMTVYRNPFHATKIMLQTEGYRAFFTGLGAVLAAAAPAQALYFCGKHKPRHESDQWVEL